MLGREEDRAPRQVDADAVDEVEAVLELAVLIRPLRQQVLPVPVRRRDDHLELLRRIRGRACEQRARRVRDGRRGGLLRSRGVDADGERDQKGHRSQRGARPHRASRPCTHLPIPFHRATRAAAVQLVAR